VEDAASRVRRLPWLEHVPVNSIHTRHPDAAARLRGPRRMYGRDGAARMQAAQSVAVVHPISGLPEIGIF
jgi:hypothetical protein